MFIEPVAQEFRQEEGDSLSVLHNARGLECLGVGWDHLVASSLTCLVPGLG